VKTNTVNKNKDTLLEAGRKVGLEADTESTKRVLMFRHQNAVKKSNPFLTKLQLVHTFLQGVHIPSYSSV